jgi:hypothetical protein
MDALAAGHDAAVQMIDTSIVRVPRPNFRGERNEAIQGYTKLFSGSLRCIRVHQ